jgi:glycosyltransferase involved in cell wall biosynthesis
MKLIIYMPALNEEVNIERVITSLPRNLVGIDEILYLVVDDGSTDSTAALALATGAYVVSHDQNRGVGAAFQSAVNFALEADADILVGIDADGQFDSGEIPSLIAPILENKAAMVMGNRFCLGRPRFMSKIKYWGNKQVAKILHYVGGRKFQDVSCGFRAYGREALLHLNIFGEFTYTHETILSLVYQGQSVVEHPIKVHYDPARKSRVAASLFRYATQTIKIILRTLLDYRPIRIFGMFGSLCFIVGTGFELFLFGHYWLMGSFTPYKATGFIGLGFITFGTLVLLMALIADMLNRLRINQDRLLYELKKNRYLGR